MRSLFITIVTLTIGISGIASTVRGADCPVRDKPIDTDRPDVTNSSYVVPISSVQIESGVDTIKAGTEQSIDGPQARVRFGMFRCGEVLVDLPSYHNKSVTERDGSSSPVTLSVKRQVFEDMRSFTMSVTAGIELPNRPYVQVPWSRSIADHWEVGGMVTLIRSARGGPAGEPTVALDRDVGSRGYLFLESIGDYATHEHATHTLDVGGGARLTPTQQLDFHIGRSLSRNSPRHYVGVGYSIRFDPSR